MSKLPQLQEKELQYLQDTDFLSTKLRLMKALQTLLEQAQGELHVQKKTLQLPDEIWQVPPKISRGENYESLPYLVLDFPRVFLQETIFAYRCMFWWGHGFNCTLHLSGTYWQHYKNLLLRELPRLQDQDWWLCVHDSPWEYHYRPDNYRLLQNYLTTDPTLAEIEKKSFFKISRRLPLEQYQELPHFCLQTLQQLSNLLKR